MRDRNDLLLSPVSETLNAYKNTAVNLKIRRYRAVVYASRKHNNEFSMFTLKNFKDPRDAAYAGQKFQEMYDKQTIRDMVNGETFREIANEFIDNLEFPEWGYPAEGLTIEDIECDYGYKTNRVEGSREALLEAIKIYNVKIPSLAESAKLMAMVEELYNIGMDYRAAAREALGV